MEPLRPTPPTGKSEPIPAPLRVGIVMESLAPPAWIARAVETVAESQEAVLVLFLRCAPAPDLPRNAWLPSLYARFDSARFRSPDDALAIGDLARRFAHIAVLEACDGATDTLALDPSVRAHELDVILTFGHRNATAESRTMARFGIWSIVLSDGLRELVTRQTHTVAELRRLDGEGGTILRTARVATDAASPRRTLNRLRWKCATLAARALRDLSITGSADPQTTEAPAESQPVANAQMIAPLFSIAARYAAQHIRSRTIQEQWFVAFRFREPGEDPIGNLRAFHRIEPPSDRMWADPFVIQDGDRVWIFIEELVFAEGRGVLAVIEARRDGSWSAPVRILERPYHLSYPSVFRWNGAFYLVPESASSGTVQLFRATAFPHRWEPVAVLLRDLEAFDPTLFEHNGRWWMYLSTASTAEVFDELSLYVAETPFGPWTAHRGNPILSDPRGGRSAGRPFVRNGMLVRAAQNSVRHYGHAMELREIVTLSETRWEERVIGDIVPDWARGLNGTHTLNVDGEVTAIDGAKNRWRW